MSRFEPFVKKTQKTPPKEINRAKKYRDDYLHRQEKGAKDEYKIL